MTTSQDPSPDDLAALRLLAKEALGEEPEESDGVLVVDGPPSGVECHLSLQQSRGHTWVVVSSPLREVLPEPVALAEINDLNSRAVGIRCVRLPTGLVVVAGELRLDRAIPSELQQLVTAVSQAHLHLALRAAMLRR